MMHFFKFLVLVALFVMCAGGDVQAQDEEPKTKVLGKKNDYTAAPATPKEEVVQEQKEEKSAESPVQQTVAPTVCTDEHRRMLEEHNKLLISFYEDYKLVRESGGQFESNKDLEELQKNAEVYGDLITSEEYKNASILRELCNYPAPPIGLDWPEWMPMRDPFKPDPVEEKDPK